MRGLYLLSCIRIKVGKYYHEMLSCGKKVVKVNILVALVLAGMSRGRGG